MGQGERGTSRISHPCSKMETRAPKLPVHTFKWKPRQQVKNSFQLHGQREHNLTPLLSLSRGLSAGPSMQRVTFGSFYSSEQGLQVSSVTSAKQAQNATESTPPSYCYHAVARGMLSRVSMPWQGANSLSYSSPQLSAPQGKPLPG